MNMNRERSRFFQRHAGALGIRLKVQNEERLGCGLDYLQEVFCLRDAIASCTKVIRSPQQPSLLSFSTIRNKVWIYITKGLRGLVDHTENPCLSGFCKINNSVVVR